MAAASTDKFRKGARKWVGQIGAGGVSDDTTATIPLSSATNLPTDTAVDVIIDRVDSSGTKTPSLEETVTGVVSGSNLVTCIRGVEGTAQAHLAGAVVEVLWTNSTSSALIDGILVEHNQDGTHKALTSPALTTPKITTSINDANGNEVIKTPATGSAVNEITVTNAATGNAPEISATGGDDNIDLKLTAKGTGKLLQDAFYQTPQTYTPDAAATATLDLSTGNEHRITMPAGNITIAISNEVSGQKFIISILQDGVGSRTVTWFTTIRWASGSAPTLTTTANKRDVFGFICTGTDTYDGFVVGRNI